MNKFKTKCRS